MTYKLNPHDLELKLEQQLNFLRSSLQSFDNGAEYEAIRIALTLRILLHDKGQNKSLLGQLSLKNRLIYCSAVFRYLPVNIVSYAGLCQMQFDKTNGKYVPVNFDDQSLEKKYVDFETWWNEIIFDDKNTLFSRKDIILMVTEKEGGAHVDSKLPESYYALTSLNSLGVKVCQQNAEGEFQDFNMENNPAYISLRVIADELLYSLSIDKDYSLFKRKEIKDFHFSCRYMHEHRYIAYYPKNLSHLGEKLYMDQRVTNNVRLKAYADIMINVQKNQQNCVVLW